MKTALAPCLALAALHCFSADLPAAHVGVFTAVKAPVAVLRGDETISARVGDELRLGDCVQTGVGGRAKILFQDEVLLLVTENTAVAITKHLFDTKRSWRDSVFDLRKGMIRSTLEKYSPDSAFIVNSPNAIAGVKGTDFLVRHTPGAEPLTELFVFQGTVEVKNRLARLPDTVSLTAGSRTEVRGNAPPLLSSPLSASDRGELDAASSLADQVTAKACKGVVAPLAGMRGRGQRGAASAAGGVQGAMQTQNLQVSVAGQDFIPSTGMSVTLPGAAVRPSTADGAKVSPGGNSSSSPVGPAARPPAAPPVGPPVAQ